MKTDSITFKSKIRFVNKHEFYNTLAEDAKYIDFTLGRKNIISYPEFFSKDVRTCTAGGITDTVKQAAGFHFFDDNTNLKNIDKFKDMLLDSVKSPVRGLILGGKKVPGRPYSVEQFEQWKNLLQEITENLTVFGKHKTSGETHFAYSLKNDLWTLCSDFIKTDNNNKPIGYKTLSSIDDFKDCFEKVCIAKGDRLFLNNTEITEPDCPKIFI